MIAALVLAVIRLRQWIFKRVNGAEGIPVPGPLVGAEHFERVYSDPAADGRSRGAGLSDLFWYWLAPGPELHQEHLEPGPRYDEVARTTKRMLKISKQESRELVAACVERAVSRNPDTAARLVRLRDFWMPIWAEFYYELVFRERCPDAARKLIGDNANDVVTALKCCGLRHMDRRERLTRYLRARLEAGELAEILPAFSLEERALYLQGVYFNTAVVQMSEAMAHILLCAQGFTEHDDDSALDRLIDETLRVHPLFGVAHRITSAPIVVDERVTLPAGSVLLFNYLAFQRTGPAADDAFDPARWQRLSRKEAHFIPYGVTANRACPARGIAPVMLRAATREVLRRYAIASSAAHTRSLPSRGPAYLTPAGLAGPGRTRLALMRARDRWADAGRSIVQLVLGTWMVADARRQRLCTTYFEEVRQ